MRVTFDGAADTQPPMARILLVEALARAVDRSGNGALRNCTVTIGEGAGLDVLGRVWLPYDHEEAWPEVLAAVDVGLVWERKAHFERVRELEASAAASLGVASVFTSHRLSLSTAYLDFLQVRAACHAKRVCADSQRIHGARGPLEPSLHILERSVDGKCAALLRPCCTVYSGRARAVVTCWLLRGAWS